jgi:hypothetical protein
MSILIRNGHLLAGERFEAWREAACQARLAPVEVHSDNQAGFRFALRYSDLGATRVSRFAVMPYQVRRTSKLIRQSDPERLSVGMLLHGHGIISQAGRQAHVPSGAFTLYDSSLPYRIGITCRRCQRRSGADRELPAHAAATASRQGQAAHRRDHACRPRHRGTDRAAAGAAGHRHGPLHPDGGGAAVNGGAGRAGHPAGPRPWQGGSGRGGWRAAGGICSIRRRPPAPSPRSRHAGGSAVRSTSAACSAPPTMSRHTSIA